MKWIAPVVALWATAAAADIKHFCTLTAKHCQQYYGTIEARFAIDPSQFVAAQNAQDPPRRQIASVTLGDADFVAEALMFPGGVTGFHEDAGALGRRLMIVQPDGSARLVVEPPLRVWAGTCDRD